MIRILALRYKATHGYQCSRIAERFVFTNSPSSRSLVFFPRHSEARRTGRRRLLCAEQSRTIQQHRLCIARLLCVAHIKIHSCAALLVANYVVDVVEENHVHRAVPMVFVVRMRRCIAGPCTDLYWMARYHAPRPRPRRDAGGSTAHARRSR